MPFDGNGNWTSTFYPIDDRNNSIPISATKFDELIQNNLKQSFPKCMTIDSQTKPIANIDANNYKVTNVADPTLPKDAVNKQTFEALTEGSLRIGGVDDIQEEITKEDLANSLGLDITLPINDTILYNTVVTDTVLWQGAARSDDNTTNIIASTPIISPALTGQTAYSKWYLFVGFDNDVDKNVTLEWDTDIDGANLTNITGAKRRVGDDKNIVFPTDGSGDLVKFTRNFNIWNFNLWVGNITSGTATSADSFDNYAYILVEAQNTEISNGIQKERFNYNNLVSTALAMPGTIDDQFCGLALSISSSTAVVLGYNPVSRMALRRITGVK